VGKLADLALRRDARCLEDSGSANHVAACKDETTITSDRKYGAYGRIMIGTVEVLKNDYAGEEVRMLLN
jgi:hypothetical protein